MPGISEKPVSPDTRLSIKKCARSASKLLGIEPRASTPSIIAASIDEFICQWQAGKRPDPIALPPDDAPLIIGSLWGEALVSRFKWDWAMITFQDNQNVMVPAAVVPAVVSADRSLAIYPLDFLLACFTDSTVEVTVLQVYNQLKAGRVPHRRPGEYFNLMDAAATSASPNA
jgi:hypothetical protein